MTSWTRFWKWYEKHFTKTLLITWVLLMTQIPHFIWAGDMFMGVGIVARQSVFLDGFLYAIDFLEIPLMVNVTMQVYSKYVPRKRNK